jgi:hypothetical protein
MEPDRVIEAIHALEVTLLERIHLHTTALGVNNERLDHLCKAVDRHREILYGHDDGDHIGLVAQMNELQKSETERKWTVRTVTASFLGLTGKFLWDFWHL